MSEDILESRDATDLATKHYTEYGIYVNQTRALPSIYDGLKLVQRRIIYEANKLPDKLTKSTNLIGNAIKLHPHGSASIYDAMIRMASPLCNLSLFDTKGNWGGWGFGAAADRYTECKLSEIARFIYCQFIDYAPMQEGEIPGTTEPAYLPCLIPYGLFEGSSGMGIGLAGSNTPLNILDLIDYYLDYIEHDYVFDHSKIIRPEFGPTVLWMSNEECIENVHKYHGSFGTTSIISQESDTVFVIETIYGKSIDKVIDKLNKYISTEKVDFRNETKTHPRFVFEIMDSSVDPAKFKDDLQNATWKKSTFNRVFDVSGKSIYSTLDFSIKKQMKALNETIDRMISMKIAKLENRKELFEGLEFFKSKGILDYLTQKTEDEVVKDMLKFNKYSEEVCRKIIQKPIGYLTKSHMDELNEINKALEDLQNHNRKEYLLDLYKKLKEMVQGYMIKKDRHFSILESQIVTNPRARLIWEDGLQKIQISDKGRGLKFNNFLYLVGESGTVYRRSISTMSKQIVNIDIEEFIVGIVPDTDSYISMEVSDGFGVVFGSSNYKYDKKWANLGEGQKITKVTGYSEANVPDNIRCAVRSKICKPFCY